MKNYFVILNLFLFFPIFVKAQYSCDCGNVQVLNLIKSSSGPGCQIQMDVRVTATSSNCVNNSWTWNTTPSGSSGSIYVGFSNTVPYSVNSVLNFYLPEACSNGGFVNFFTPNGSLCTMVPLPVRFIGLYQHDNLLLWKVASETNCMTYIVQGSLNGDNWQEIDTIDCKNTLSQKEYSTQISDKYKLIRIVQIDFDGTASYSDILEWNIKSAAKPKYRDITTNVNSLNSDLEKLLGVDTHVNIIDVNGRFLFHGKVSNLGQLAINSGIYFVRINGEYENIKLFVL